MSGDGPKITDAWLERAESQMESGDLSGMFVNRDDVLALIRECRRLRLLAIPATDDPVRRMLEDSGWLPDAFLDWLFRGGLLSHRTYDEVRAYLAASSESLAALSSPETTPAPNAGLDVERLDAALRVGLIEVIPERRGIGVGYFEDEHLRRLAAAIAAEYDRLALREPE